MQMRGKLERQDLGSGVWVLQTTQGERVQLVGDVPAMLNGREVDVEGDELDAMGFGMVGDRIVEVRAVRAR